MICSTPVWARIPAYNCISSYKNCFPTCFTLSYFSNLDFTPRTTFSTLVPTSAFTYPHASTHSSSARTRQAAHFSFMDMDSTCSSVGEILHLTSFTTENTTHVNTVENITRSCLVPKGGTGFPATETLDCVNDANTTYIVDCRDRKSHFMLHASEYHSVGDLIHMYLCWRDGEWVVKGGEGGRMNAAVRKGGSNLVRLGR